MVDDARAGADRSRHRICILASMGWGVRNVLMSQAMEPVLQQCEVHALTTFHHVPGFRERFAHLDGEEELPSFRLTRWERVLNHLSMLLFFRASPSSTHAWKVGAYRNRYGSGRIMTKKERLTRIGVNVVGVHMAHPRLRGIVRRLLHWRMRKREEYAFARRFFQERGISLVLSSNPLNDIESPALVAAQDLGIPTLAVITSWDNLSSKNPYIIEFDHYFVWSPLMAEEVLLYCDGAERAHIEEIGPLQFDYYFDERFFEDRDAFCRRYGFDPARKIVVHSLVTQGLMPDEGQLIERLLLALKAGRIKGDPNLLIRLHPKRDIAEFSELVEDPRFKDMRVAWTEPGEAVRDRNDRWCPMDDEVALLTNTVRHGDVNLNVFSTMLIDFAVLDKPAVLVSHDAEGNPRTWDHYEHLKPIYEAGGHAVTLSFEETLDALNTYLENPAVHREGRRRVVEVECGAYVGRAHERLAELLPRLARDASSP